jgi:hypothetical protein
MHPLERIVKMKNRCTIRLYGIGLGVLMAVLVLNGGVALAEEPIDLGTIMPMGDSLTVGFPVPGGYRLPLYEKLIAANYQFQFVGTETYYDPSPVLVAAGQEHHEGHGGYWIHGDYDCHNGNVYHDGLYENLDQWIDSDGDDTDGKYTPDIILLDIGINQLGYVVRRDEAPDDLRDLIDSIYGVLPNVTLYVSSLTVRDEWQEDGRVETFNATLPGIVADNQLLGRDVHFVDMYPHLTVDDLSDAVHPNAGGYQKMGQVWFNAIHTPEPGSAMLLLGLSTGLWMKRKRRTRK